jgi:uncharacterized protein (TIGR04255 family)
MNEEHTTYPNPTIIEALCEIHFRLPEGATWQDSLFGKLFLKVRSRFPELEPVTQPTWQLQMGTEGPKILSSQGRIRFRQPEGNVLLQLSENIFTVNILPKYPGWAKMQSELLDDWAEAREVIQPARIARIGLRYINRIEGISENECPGDWLASSDYVAKSVLASQPGFLSRVEVRSDVDNRLIVTVGDATTSTEPGIRALIFDIDCIAEKEIGVENDAIKKQIARLHDVAWNVFSASMTVRLESLLRGGAK